MSGLLTKYFGNEEINNPVEIVEFNKGNKILKPYEKTKYLFEVRRGLVKLYTLSSNSKENIGAVYGPGDLFPLSWLINQNRPGVCIEALTDCKLNLIALRHFRKQVETDSELSVEFVKRVCRQFSLFATTVNNLGFKFGKERIAYCLLVLAVRFGEKKNGEIVFPYITHKDFGSVVNMTRESVNIEMNKLMKREFIEYNRLNITIKNPDALQKILGKDVPIIFFDNI